jgi:protein-disulfide isomerase
MLPQDLTMLKLLSTDSRTTRRSVIAGSAAAVAVLTVPFASAFAQRKPAAAADVSIDELMKPGTLPDLILGKADAPVTIVEYASLTCGHCAAFHNKVLPVLKEKYVETGKVRIIMREFPLQNLAAGAAMLARCAGGGEKTIAFTTALFAKQEEWAFQQQNPLPELFKFAKQAGFTQESFDKCLTDQKLLDDITAVRARASDVFGVDATPTFFINGKRFTSAPTIEAFEKAIGEIVKS